jgi:glutamate-1-semialdehyde 2,1-aminomutase
MNPRSRSEEYFRRACRSIPGGVNSPVRAFRSVGGTPVVFRRGAGAVVTDLDGHEYVDFCGSWGPLLLGHADPDVVAAVQRAAADGLSFGACHPLEAEFAEAVKALCPGVELVRAVNSGTEAVMTALRLARGVTKRDRILKFDGGYHGHADALLVQAGSGVLAEAGASSGGVSGPVAAETISVAYNDLAAVEAAFGRYPDAIAAVIVEPVAGNMGLVLPEPGFLAGLRELTARHGALLIFDEVITGFRFHPGSYADLCGVRPDLFTFGKIVGGGLPVGAVGGAAGVMSALAPLGPVYQAGTLSGNPVALAAGLATLRKLRSVDYPALAAGVAGLAAGLNAAAQESGVPAHCAAAGSVFTLFFTPGPVRNLADALRSDTARFARYFHHMLDAGFYLPPAQFELNFVSTAHTGDHLRRFEAAARAFFHTLAP